MKAYELISFISKPYIGAVYHENIGTVGPTESECRGKECQPMNGICHPPADQ